MSEELFAEEVMEEPSQQDEELDANVKLHAHDLFVRLQRTFTEPAYITLEEVRDATGFDGKRTADAIAISLYRSRGKCIWGFEFKVSRNDWLKELKQPEKAEQILRYCHHWALVVPDKDIVKPGELPSTWGLYVAQKDRLKCVTPTPLLEPVPMDMRMFTAICYAISSRQKRADEAALKAARDEGYKEGVHRSGSDKWEQYYNELREKVEAFEKSSGIYIQYNRGKIENIGEAVQLLMSGDSSLNQELRHFEYAVRCANDTAKTITESVRNFRSVLEKMALRKGAVNPVE